MSEVSTSRYGVYTDRWADHLDKKGDPIPMSIYGDEHIERDLDGMSSGETRVDDVSPEAVERMAMMCEMAIERARTKIPDESDTTGIDQLSEYLQEINEAQVALKEKHPLFSDKTERWVTEYISEAGREDDALGRILAYNALLADLYGDYQSEIEAKNISAQAEWNVMQEIIEAKLRGLEAQPRIDGLSLAA